MSSCSSSSLKTAVFKKNLDVIKSTWSPLQWSGREQLRVKAGKSGELHIQIVAQSALAWLVSCLYKFLTCGAAKSIGKRVSDQDAKTLDVKVLKGRLTDHQILLLAAIQRAKLNTSCEELQQEIDVHTAALVKQMPNKTSAEKKLLNQLVEQTIALGTWLDEQQMAQNSVHALYALIQQGKECLHVIKNSPLYEIASPPNEAPPISFSDVMTSKNISKAPSQYEKESTCVIVDASETHTEEFVTLARIDTPLANAHAPAVDIATHMCSSELLPQSKLVTTLSEIEKENICKISSDDAVSDLPTTRLSASEIPESNSWDDINPPFEEIDRENPESFIAFCTDMYQAITSKNIPQLTVNDSANDLLFSIGKLIDNDHITLNSLQKKLSKWRFTQADVDANSDQVVKNLEAYCSALTLCLEQLATRGQQDRDSLTEILNSLVTAPATFSLANTFMAHYSPLIAVDYYTCPFSNITTSYEAAIQAAADAKEMLTRLQLLAEEENLYRQTLPTAYVKAENLLAKNQLVSARLLQKEIKANASLCDNLIFKIKTSQDVLEAKEQLRVLHKLLRNMCAQTKPDIALLDQLKMPGLNQADRLTLRQLLIEETHQKIQRYLDVFEHEQKILEAFLADIRSQSWKKQTTHYFDQKTRLLHSLVKGLPVQEKGWLFTNTNIMPVEALTDTQIAEYQQFVDVQLKLATQTLEQETVYSSVLNAYESYTKLIQVITESCQAWEAKGSFLAIHEMQAAVSSQQTLIAKAKAALSSKNAMLAFADMIKNCQIALEKCLLDCEKHHLLEPALQLKALAALDSAWLPSMRRHLIASVASKIDTALAQIATSQTASEPQKTEALAQLEALKTHFEAKRHFWQLWAAPIEIEQLSHEQLIDYAFFANQLCENLTPS